MGVNYYTSEDAGAPALSGQVGALIALLDAVLVNGYGSKAALGWTKAFSGTNKAAYRLDHATNSGRYLRVDDSNAQYAIVNAYDVMSDVDTGTGGFPATATARYWRKSSNSDATARPWAIYGDEAFMHFFAKWHSNATYSYIHHVFGDLLPAHDSPGAVSMFSGSSSGSESFPGQQSDLHNINTTSALDRVHAIPDAAGTLTEVKPRLVGHYMTGSALGDGRLNVTGSAEPNGAALRCSPMHVARDGGNSGSTNWIMGMLPGLLAPWYRMSAALGGTEYDDLIDGGARNYRVQAANYGNASAIAAVLIDVSGPWR